MKNMKKLLVVLPLVLILVLGAVPVFANNNWAQCKLPDWKYDMNAYWLACTTNCYPIWVGEAKNPCHGTPKEGVDCSKVPTGNYKIWNNGQPYGWITANPNVISPLQLAHLFLDDQGLSAQYKIRDLEINNVHPVDTSVALPEKMFDKNWKGQAKDPITAGTPIKTVTIPGYLIIVEPLYQEVTINHHIQREGQPEIVETNVAMYPTNDQLTAERVPAEWALTKYVDVSYDPTQTVVSPVNQFDRSLGQYIFKGWVVDMFYTAGAAAPADTDNSQVDAVNAGVQLPATGAVSNVFLMIGSAAMIVLGLFAKK